MSRPRLIPDATVLDAVLRLWLTEGDRAVTFARVAERSGLSRAALVGRYGSRDRLLEAAGAFGWDGLDAALALALDQGKGPAGLLKALDGERALHLCARSNHGPLRDRALAWRRAVEAALSARLGRTAPDTAATLFAAWQGEALWAGGVRLKDLAKRLT